MDFILILRENNVMNGYNWRIAYLKEVGHICQNNKLSSPLFIEWIIVDKYLLFIWFPNINIYFHNALNKLSYLFKSLWGDFLFCQESS
jgi:hypothetical protein